MSHLRAEFAEHASTDAIRTQYERAQAQADLWNDRARDLFLLLCQREDQANAPVSQRPNPVPGRADRTRRRASRSR